MEYKIIITDLRASGVISNVETANYKAAIWQLKGIFQPCVNLATGGSELGEEAKYIGTFYGNSEAEAKAAAENFCLRMEGVKGK